MAMLSYDELAAQAGVNPWQLLEDLQAGDPSQIESLSAAFYKAGGDLSDAHTSSARASAYVKAGYVVNGAPAVDYNGEAKIADKYVADQATRSSDLRQIAKILDVVGGDLKTATASAAKQVGDLESQLTSIDNAYTSGLMGHRGDEMDPQELDGYTDYYINQAVAAVKSYGGTIKTTVTNYESTLASSLKSMSNLGYIPPDDVDEGPDDVNLDTGTTDGQATVSAATSKNTTKLDQSTLKLQLINNAIKANGGHVSDAEYGYLSSYYDATAKHSDVIDNAIKGDKSLTTTIGARYADGLLNLTQGSEQTDDEGVGAYVRDEHGVGTFGRGGYDGLPQNVLDVMNSRIGEMGPTPKSGGTSPTGGPDILRAVWKDGHWEIPNYANDTGFGDLLGYADTDVAGSNAFSQHLATTAINWKHDTDAVVQNTAAWGALDYTGLPGQDKFGQLDYPRPDGADPFKLGITDSGASGLLTAASHNQVASAQILLNSTDRHAILGLPWQGSGAERLIDVGTAPDPNNTMIDPNHPGVSLRNEAALAVVKDAGSNYQDFAKTVSDPVKSALTQLAVTHLASFGQPTGDQAGSSIGMIDTPTGSVHGLSLNNTDAANYLKMVSLTGPKDYGIVHAAALELGSQWLHNGQPGGTGAGSGADHASTLIGRVTSSGYAAAVDAASSKSGDEQKIYIAQLKADQEEATKDALQKGVLDAIDTGLSVASFGASDHIADAIDKISFAMDTVDTANDDYGAYTSAGVNTTDQARLIEIGKEVQGALTQPQNNAQVQTSVNADLGYMAVRAQGTGDPNLAYTGTADQINSVVDPAINTYYGPGGGSQHASQAIASMLPDPNLDPQKPTVDWAHDPTVRKLINGGENTVYDSPIDYGGLGMGYAKLTDVTPK